MREDRWRPYWQKLKIQNVATLTVFLYCNFFRKLSGHTSYITHALHISNYHTTGCKKCSSVKCKSHHALIIYHCFWTPIHSQQHANSIYLFPKTLEHCQLHAKSIVPLHLSSQPILAVTHYSSIPHTLGCTLAEFTHFSFISLALSCTHLVSFMTR